MSAAEVIAPVEGYPASRLRDMAEDWLCERHPSALIIREFCIGSWGAALIDLAAVTETEIVGVEIKGDGDSPSRLKLQGALYAKAAQRMWLLPAPSIFERCEREHLPGWGLLGIKGDQLRSSKATSRLNSSPGQLLECLWAAELRQLGLRLGFSPGSATCEKMRQFLADEVPLKTLVPKVCEALRARNWAKAGLYHKIRWATIPVQNRQTVTGPGTNTE